MIVMMNDDDGDDACICLYLYFGTVECLQCLVNVNANCSVNS